MGHSKLDAEIAAARAKLASLEGAAAGCDTQGRKVSLLLGVGILLMPIFFVWLLYRPGYSKKVRIYGTAWLVLVLVAIGVQNLRGGETTAPPDPLYTLVADPDFAAKYQAAGAAKIIVPKMMKDPSSAKFGKVWGMSAYTACGFVNGKNSFGGMTGNQRFILSGDTVLFQGAPGFSARWNKLCVERLPSKPPTGALDVRWGGPPNSNMTFYSDAGDGLTVYTVKGPVQFEGVPADNAVANFERRRFFGVMYTIMGEANRDAVLKALVERYGRPLEFDVDRGHFKWSWPAARVSIAADYNKETHVTLINLEQGGPS